MNIQFYVTWEFTETGERIGILHAGPREASPSAPPKGAIPVGNTAVDTKWFLQEILKGGDLFLWELGPDGSYWPAESVSDPEPLRQADRLHRRLMIWNPVDVAWIPVMP